MGNGHKPSYHSPGPGDPVSDAMKDYMKRRRERQKERIQELIDAEERELEEHTITCLAGPIYERSAMSSPYVETSAVPSPYDVAEGSVVSSIYPETEGSAISTSVPDLDAEYFGRNNIGDDYVPGPKRDPIIDEEDREAIKKAAKKIVSFNAFTSVKNFIIALLTILLAIGVIMS